MRGLCVDGQIILKWILRAESALMWTAFLWHIVWIIDKLFWTQWWTFCFTKSENL